MMKQFSIKFKNNLVSGIDIIINMCMKLWVQTATEKCLKCYTLLSAETVIRGEK